MLKWNWATTLYVFPQLQWVQTVTFTISIFGASHFFFFSYRICTYYTSNGKSAGNWLASFMMGTRFSYSSHEKPGSRLMVTSCMLEDARVTVNTHGKYAALWHLMLKEIAPDWGRTSSRGKSHIWKKYHVNTC